MIVFSRLTNKNKIKIIFYHLFERDMVLNELLIRSFMSADSNTICDIGYYSLSKYYVKQKWCNENHFQLFFLTSLIDASQMFKYLLVRFFQKRE